VLAHQEKETTSWVAALNGIEYWDYYYPIPNKIFYTS
jgi:hypothetical protein